GGRGGVRVGRRGSAGPGGGIGSVLALLQRGAAAPVAGLPDASGGLRGRPTAVGKGEVGVSGKAFFFAPHALSSKCEGRAGRKRMPRRGPKGERGGQKEARPGEHGRHPSESARPWGP